MGVPSLGSKGCCSVQAPSKGCVHSEGEKERRKRGRSAALLFTLKDLANKVDLDK